MNYLKLLTALAVALCFGAANPSTAVDRLADELYSMPRAYRLTIPKQEDGPYRARMGTISQAIYSVPRQWRPYVGAVWVNETHLAWDVHQGKPGWYGSDGGRAKCFGQIHRHRKLNNEQWLKLGGTDLASTTRCALETARLLAAGAHGCKLTDPGRIFDAYGRGNCIERMDADRRAKRVKTLARMRRVIP